MAKPRTECVDDTTHSASASIVGVEASSTAGDKLATEVRELGRDCV